MLPSNIIGWRVPDIFHLRNIGRLYEVNRDVVLTCSVNTGRFHCNRSLDSLQLKSEYLSTRRNACEARGGIRLKRRLYRGSDLESLTSIILGGSLSVVALDLGRSWLTRAPTLRTTGRYRSRFRIPVYTNFSPFRFDRLFDQNNTCMST